MKDKKKIIIVGHGMATNHAEHLLRCAIESIPRKIILPGMRTVADAERLKPDFSKSPHNLIINADRTKP